MMMTGMRGRLGSAILCVGIAGSAAVRGETPQDELLAHFKEKIRHTLTELPNYTCLETIQRSERRPRAHAFKPLDTVLLEVSTTGNKELLAWPGARRFEDADVTAFVSGGLFGSGIFAQHARNIFLYDTTVIKYKGAEEIAGRAVTRYNFSVPQALSRLQIQTSSGTAVVGTEGSFWIDPTSLQLIRLEVVADGLPAALGIAKATTRIDYAPMRVGASDVLLPQGAELLMALTAGKTMRNVIQFSHCRGYQSESAIRFDVSDAAPQASKPAVRELDLPAGLTVPIELQTAIDSASAHVGDLLRGSVLKDVKLKGNTIIPKGAAVAGRIRGLDPASPSPSLALTIELEDVTWEGAHAEFYGDLVKVSAAEGPLTDVAFPSIGLTPEAMAPAGPRDKSVIAPRIPGTGVLYMIGQRFRLPKGLRMSWLTLDPNGRQRGK